jgi:thiol-disulfide isomerase/thioredoxin
LDVTDWLTKSQFEEIGKKPGSHLIVFAARWCGFCSRFLQQAKSLPVSSNAQLNLVDADNPDESLWDEYSIKIVPTLLVFDDSKVVFRRDGKSGAGLAMADLQEAISKIKASA